MRERTATAHETERSRAAPCVARTASGTTYWPLRTTYAIALRSFFRRVSPAGIEPVGFRTKSDLRNHQAIIQPRLYDCLMVTQITLAARHGKPLGRVCSQRCEQQPEYWPHQQPRSDVTPLALREMTTWDHKRGVARRHDGMAFQHLRLET